MPDDFQPEFTEENPPIQITPPEAMPQDAFVSAAQLRSAQQQDDDGQAKFPIVGLGGSAGSVEALEHFFLNMPPNSGLAFAVVVHQLPNASSELVQVLQNFTRMPVLAAQDGLRMQPNHVYVLPPNQEMSVLHGTLLLFAPAPSQGHAMSIDFFLQSLAKDARERAVCIILSGLGTDGTTGLKMIVENYGMVMVQAPETAEFDSMPRSAIATEFVDYVLPAEQLPSKLLDYLSRPLATRMQRDIPEEAGAKPTHALQKIFTLIRAQTGHDFSFYKRNTVFRRLERRMNSHQIKEVAHYVRYLQENSQEVDLLFKELLIGVTKFFRDPGAYESLRTRLLPLLRDKSADSTVRVWAPGCSTGEEAYSLAMVLLECLGALNGDQKYLKVQIFATDINVEAIDFARVGLYPENIVADVSGERLRRFFTKLDGYYQIRKEVRDVVVFAVHNINRDAPFTKLDLLCCRNLLIYLSAELQKNLLPVFHYALNPGGLLFLGPSENLTGFQDLFTPLDIKWKISRRSNGASPLTRVANFPFAMTRHRTQPTHPGGLLTPAPPRRNGPFAIQVQKVLLRAFTPPAVVINGKGEILYVNGRTGKYLEPAPGLSGMNIFDMARDELNFEISEAVQQVLREHTAVVVEGVKVKTELGYQLLRLTVQYLDQPEAVAGLLLVAFEDQPTPVVLREGQEAATNARDERMAALERELQFTKQRLQTTVEEMESSLEELKSTNEELQSANEELQSTNEEAMTNKEEMQSLNEELITLNMQYMSKTKELSEAANDMKNLLDSTEIAIIFLDNDLLIKRFTPPIARIINLLPSDVGRPITHFASNLRHASLAQDVQQVLDRLTSAETVIQTTAGEWFAMRILPYRTLDNYISGAVITFSDITQMKHLEQQLQTSTALAESIVETVREAVLVLDINLCVLTASQAFYRQFGLDPATSKGKPLPELQEGLWNQPALLRRLQALQHDQLEFEDMYLYLATPQPRHLEVYGRRITSQGQQTDRLLLGLHSVPAKPDQQDNAAAAKQV